MIVPQTQLIAQLESALRAGPSLRLAVLFGSSARDTRRADSDVDVGILPEDPNLALSEELDLQARLSAACGHTVDLVRLDLATTLLRWHAARDAMVLVADPPQEFARFRARAAIEHAELRILRDPVAERFRKALVSSATHRARQ